MSFTAEDLALRATSAGSAYQSLRYAWRASGVFLCCSGMRRCHGVEGIALRGSLDAVECGAELAGWDLLCPVCVHCMLLPMEGGYELYNGPIEAI